MTDNSNPTPPEDAYTGMPEVSVDAGSMGNANLIYILYLANIIVPFTSLVGVIMAYVGKGDANPVVKSHYNHQINIFWKALLYAVVGAILSIILIGFLIMLWGLVWYVVRSIQGIQAAGRGEPIANPGSWLFS